MGFFSRLFGGIFSKEAAEEVADIVVDTGHAIGKAYLDAEVQKQLDALRDKCADIQNPELRLAIVTGLETLAAALKAAYARTE